MRAKMNLLSSFKYNYDTGTYHKKWKVFSIEAVEKNSYEWLREAITSAQKFYFLKTPSAYVISIVEAKLEGIPDK